MAQLSFSSIFKSASANQGEESSSFLGSKLAGATNIRFVSQNPADVRFSGNNVPGDMYYTLNGTEYKIAGIVSRQVKTGSATDAFYFVDSGSDYLMGSKEVTTAYLLVWPGHESAVLSAPTSNGLSSDPVDAGLNALLDAQPTLVDITQNEADLTLDVNQTVLYTFKFSKDMDAASFTSADILNTGTSSVTFGTITEISPGVFTVQVTPTTAGTVKLAIAAGAIITSPDGFGLNTSTQIPDNETLNVVAATAPTITSVTAEDAATAPGSGDSTVVEGNPLRYTVGLSKAPTTPTDFTLATSGTASAADYGSYTFSNGVTYNAATGKITVPAGVTSFTITVPTVDDTQVESTETLVLTVGGAAGTGTIVDNDSVSIASVTAEDAATAPGSGDSTVVEGNALRYTVSLTKAPSAATTFPLAASGTAAAADYGSYTFSDGVTYDPATGLITVPAGVSSFKITVPTVDDTAIEDTETLVLSVGGVAGTGTILDNDSPAIASVTAEDGATAPGSGDSTVVEGNPLRFAVALTAAPIKATTFTLAAAGTAAAADYGNYTFSDGVTYDAATGKITVPAGVKSFTITVPTVDDTEVEKTETLVLNVGGVAGTGTILDNDAPAAPTIQSVTAEDAATNPGSGDSTVVEGNPLRYTVSLDKAPTEAITFPLATSGTAAAADYGNYSFSDGVTYNPATGLITVPAGVSSFKITVPTVDDTKVEPTETLVLTVGGVPGTGTILDNDEVKVVSITSPTTGDTTAVEGNPLRFVVTLSDTTVEPTPFALSASGAAASGLGTYTYTNGVTYDPATGKLNVPAGVSSFVVIAPTADNTVPEPSRSMILSVGNSSATGTVLDNDAIPVYFSTSTVLPDDRQLSLTGTAAKNIQFYVNATTTANDPLQLKAWYNPITGDWFYGRADVAAPYECYVLQPQVQLGTALPKGKGAFDVHTYMNAEGTTQIMSEAAAADLGLLTHGYHDLGDSYVFASTAALTGLPTV